MTVARTPDGFQRGASARELEMCGRYTNRAAPEELSEHFGLPIRSPAGTGRFNIAPTEKVLCIVAPSGEREARMLRWGLVPQWAKDLRTGPLMINARLETVSSKPAFRALLPHARRRALQIADGYFEWLKPERKGQRPQPFLFEVDGGAPFAFASLWTQAHIGGEDVESVVMLTRDASANPLAAAIHDRMPVILADAEAQRAWLDPALDAEAALSLCDPLPDSRLCARPVNRALNRRGVREDRQLLDPEGRAAGGVDAPAAPPGFDAPGTPPGVDPPAAPPGLDAHHPPRP